MICWLVNIIIYIIIFYYYIVNILWRAWSNLLCLWSRRRCLFERCCEPSRRSLPTTSDRFWNQQTKCWFCRFFLVSNRGWTCRPSPAQPSPPHSQQNGSSGAGGRAAWERARFPPGERGRPDSALWKFEPWWKEACFWFDTSCRPFHGRFACSRCTSEPSRFLPMSKNIRLLDWKDWKPLLCYKQLFPHDWGFCVFIATGIRKSFGIISCLTV